VSDNATREEDQTKRANYYIVNVIHITSYHMKQKPLVTRVQLAC